MSASVSRKGLWFGGLVVGVCVALLFSGACGTPTGGGGGGGGGEETSAVSGWVVTADGTAIGGVNVTLPDGRSVATDGEGYFEFTDVTASGNVVAQFSQDGYATTTKTLPVVTNGTASANRIVMAVAAQTVQFDADTSVTQRSGDSAVTIEAGSLADADGNPVTGQVELTATFFDPSTEEVAAFPGSFENAVNEDGNTVTLESFGFAIYELTQDGKEINLAPGQTAEIEYVLPDNAQDDFAIGDTIPLWEFDEETGIWHERGEGEIRLASDGSGQLAWYATVTHFSAWNCDMPISAVHCLTGRVTTEGAPVVGATVVSRGISYNGLASAETGADGTFCIDVKRNSEVLLEVHLAGETITEAALAVTVPDEPARCTVGGCTAVGDIETSVTFNSCVSGRVLHEDGTPAAGIPVQASPGESDTTDADGRYCVSAPGGTTVTVYADQDQTQQVTTPANATCAADNCVEVDLTYAGGLPFGDGVAELNAAKQTSYGGFAMATAAETFNISGSFYAYDQDILQEWEDLGDLAVYQDMMEDLSTETEVFGACSVTTTTFRFSTDVSEVPKDDLNIDFDDFFEALDPGEPGLATSPGATVELMPPDAGSSAGSTGSYVPVPVGVDLLGLGFDAGEIVTFDFPGGVDIGAFTGSIEVPPDVTVLSPDLTDDDFTITPGAALPMTWVADDVTEYVIVDIGSSDIPMSSEGEGTQTFTSVQIRCEFPDDGADTVPASATALLPAESTMLSLSVARVRFGEVEVPYYRAADGTGTVALNGRSSVTRSWMSFDDLIPDIPDIPDVPDVPDVPDEPDMPDVPDIPDLPDDLDPCALVGIVCEEGEVCNTDTWPFSCVPE